MISGYPDLIGAMKAPHSAYLRHVFAFCTTYPRLSFPPDTFAVVDN